MVDTSNWPQNVKQLKVDDIDYLGVDDKKKLYWDGSPVVTSLLQNLSRGERNAARAVAIAAILAGVGGIVQGWVALNDLACKMHWLIAVCPPTR